MPGPLTRWELVRAARQRRFFVTRLAVLALLACTLAVIFSGADLSDPAELAVLSGRVERACLLVLLIAVCVLTPAVVAPAIAGERAAGRLDFLLASDLSAAEIVLGKGLARAATVGLVLLGALPVVGLLQLLGGVALPRLAAGAAAVLILLASVGSISLVSSVLCRSPRDAVIIAYAVVGAGWILALLATGPGLPWAIPLALFRLDPSGDGLSGFAAGHGLIAALCLIGAVHLLRPLASAWAHARPGQREHRRPAVWGSAVLWRELLVGSRPVRSWVVWGGLVGVPVFLWMGSRGTRADLGWVVCPGVATLALACCVVRSALAFTAEREGRTLELLRTTPVTALEVLLAKWAGAVLAPWRGVVLLAGVWAVSGLASGFLHLVPLALLLWLVHAAGLSALGLVASVALSRPTAALAVALGLSAVLGGGLFLAGVLCGLPYPVCRLLLGMSPPAALLWVALPPGLMDLIGTPARSALNDAVAFGGLFWFSFAAAAVTAAMARLALDWQPEARPQRPP